MNDSKENALREMPSHELAKGLRELSYDCQIGAVKLYERDVLGTVSMVLLEAARRLEDSVAMQNLVNVWCESCGARNPDKNGHWPHCKKGK